MTWGVAEMNDTPGIPESIDGLDRADLAAFVTCLPGAEFSLRSGSVGKGAAGVGATLVVLLERALSDGANLVEVGAGLWSIIHAVRKKRGADPTVSDPTTLGALAAAAVEPPVRDLIVGCTYEKTVPLTVSYEHWAGTDDRDVWATCFSHPDGFVVVIFTSPSGAVLGTTTVPAMFGVQDGEWRERTASEIADWRRS